MRSLPKSEHGSTQALADPIGVAGQVMQPAVGVVSDGASPIGLATFVFYLHRDRLQREEGD